MSHVVKLDKLIVRFRQETLTKQWGKQNWKGLLYSSATETLPTISNHQRTRVIMNRSPEYYGHSRIRCTSKRKFKFINKGNTLGHWGKDKHFSEFC